MQNERKTVFITGAGGYIGSALVGAFLERGWRVVGFGRSTRFDRLKGVYTSQNLELVEGDIADVESVRSAMRGARAVVHAAGPAGEKACHRNPYDAIRSIIRGTGVVAQSAQVFAVPRIIHLSTQSVYSTYRERSMPLKETDECLPDDWYGALKAEAEYMLRDIPAVILRLTNVYGRGSGIVEKTDAVGNFIRAARAGEALTVFGDGNQGVDFIHIDDVADIVCGFTENEELKNDTYNIGSGQLTSLKELAGTISDVVQEDGGGTPSIQYREAPQGKVWPNRWVSHEKIKTVFPNFPQRTLREGIKGLM